MPGWIFEALGIAGSLLLLLSFFLISTSRLAAASATNQWLNLFGAAFLGVNAAVHGAWPPAILEVAWCLIAIYTLVRIRLRRE